MCVTTLVSYDALIRGSESQSYQIQKISVCGKTQMSGTRTCHKYNPSESHTQLLDLVVYE